MFARELTDDLASLVKQLDAVAGKNEEKKMTGFVVLLSEDPDADETKIQEFAEKHGIKNLPLAIFDGIAGPPRYKLAKEADVTVHLYVKKEVKANHAFAKGDLTAAAVEQVVADTSKILE
ncbi:MAG: hypothetical protein H8E44_28540 [Planctomycetes bacterium]|nr:hypothetical protein [Planctomycetota bacterium]MBL7042572.1 hypothetical protein [Pirellulaceae bacterium]